MKITKTLKNAAIQHFTNAFVLSFPKNNCPNACSATLDNCFRLFANQKHTNQPKLKCAFAAHQPFSATHVDAVAPKRMNVTAKITNVFALQTDNASP